MARTAVPIELNDEIRSKLQNIVNSQKTDQELGLQAQIVLLAGQGLSNKEIAQRLSTNDRRVGRWRNRFANEGLDGLKESSDRENPPTADTESELYKAGLDGLKESPDRETPLTVETEFELYDASEEDLLIEKDPDSNEEFTAGEVCQPIQRNFCIAENEVLRKISIFGLAILFHLLLVLLLSTPSLV